MPFWGDGVEIHGKAVSDGHPTQPRPIRFIWANREHHIDHVSIYWRIHTDWWKPDGEVWRDYWEVTTDTHLRATLLYDRIGGKWYLERVME